ncbi:MAG: hypothetical protein RSA22_13920, partial [Acinetobacter sp.]
CKYCCCSIGYRVSGIGYRVSGIQEDHRAFVLVKGVARIPEAGKSNTDKNRHGDSGIAHLLCDFASCNPEAPIEFMSISISLESDEFGADLESLLSDFNYM